MADFLSQLSHIHRSEVSGRFMPTQTHALAGATTGELLLLSLPPPSSLSVALSKFSTLQSAIASSSLASPVGTQPLPSQQASQPFQRPNNP